MQNWSEGNLPSQEVTDFLDVLQHPEGTAAWPSTQDTARPPSAPSRRLWLASAQVLLFGDRDLPASGEVDLQRRFPLESKVGATELEAGVSAGSWMEGTNPYADLDLWTGLDLRRPDWNGRIEGWGGWTESNQPEVGASGAWEFKRKLDGWEIRNGPSARVSWRRTRFLGWSLRAFGPLAFGSVDLGGAIRARQDPVWPVVLDDMHVPMRFARERAQSTLHAALDRRVGSLHLGPQLDLDGRVSLQPDRWTDSIQAVVSRSERRAELGWTTSGFLRWDPTPTWSAQGALGWTWAKEWGDAGLELSSFNKGAFLRLGTLSSF